MARALASGARGREFKSHLPDINFMSKQLHLFYSGRVQGIGFRYAVLDIALGLKVRGWVKNLFDGRVEVLAESEEDTLTVFLEQIKQHFSRYIIDTTVEWLPASGEFRDFQVQF